MGGQADSDDAKLIPGCVMRCDEITLMTERKIDRCKVYFFFFKEKGRGAHTEESRSGKYV